MAIFARKALKEMGMDDETVDKVIDLYVSASATTKERLRVAEEKAATVEELTVERDGLKKELETIKAQGADVAKVQADFDAYKKQVESEKTARQKGEAFEKLLESAGVARPSARTLIRKGYDLSGIELLEDGTIKDADTITSAIKTDYADFIGEKGTYGTPTVMPPNGGQNAERRSRNPDSIAARIERSHHENLYGKKE